MQTPSTLITVADAYMAAVNLPSEKTLSWRLFGDSAKLTKMRDGADITLGRFNTAMAWFVDHWPEATAQPAALQRWVAGRDLVEGAA